MVIADLEGFDVAVRSDLYAAGRTEDGEVYIAESFFVVVTAPDGSRFQHAHSFPGCKAGYTPEEGIPYFQDVRAKAEAACERLVEQIKERGYIDLDKWIEITAVYGSDAWSEDMMVDFEAMANRREAYS